MGFVAENIFYFVLMGILLIVSGMFSGSETVLFSLSRHDRARMKKSGRRLEVMAAELLDNPRSLLTTLMIGNMGCNILFFVLSTMLLREGHGTGAEHAGRDVWGKLGVVALGVVPPLLVTYVSDVMPKVIGALNNRRIAPLVALPIATLVRALWPVSKVVDLVFIRPVHRLVTGGRRKTEDYSAEELRELLEMSEREGVIDVSENELLQEVVRIGELRVRDVMTPRVDLVAYNLKDPPEKLFALFTQSHLAKVPVYEGQTDNIVGLVYAKEALLERIEGGPGKKLEVRRLVRGVQFVPELMTLEQLITRFRASKTQLAVVVDEFGGVVGIVALEDVVEQMVGDIYEPHDRPESTTQKLAPDEYRVAGDLSVADWMEAFGDPIGEAGAARASQGRVSTVAGLMASALKRVPKVGDQVRFGHLLMTVESMRGRRVERVRMRLVEKEEPVSADVPGGGI